VCQPVPQVSASLVGDYGPRREGEGDLSTPCFCARDLYWGWHCRVPASMLATMLTGPKEALKCWSYRSFTWTKGLLHEFPWIFVTSMGARGQDLFFDICCLDLTGPKNPTGQSSSCSLTSFHIAYVFNFLFHQRIKMLYWLHVAASSEIKGEVTHRHMTWGNRGKDRWQSWQSCHSKPGI
jgi:hypothetical protein